MDLTQPSMPEPRADSSPGLDPRLQPTPDYGTLGPGSDMVGAASNKAASPKAAARGASLLAAIIGAVVALVAGTIGSAHRAWPGLTNVFSARQDQPTNVKDLRQFDGMRPQKQAETLLELAVAQKAGATEQISSRVDSWQGHLEWDAKIANLTTAALNSNDLRVRESGVEVELAAYGLSKNSDSLEYLLKTAESENHAQKIWALWALGLMGNRGVESGQVVEVLTAHLKDSDADSRRWAVEALAVVGSDPTIGVLLKTMHDDAAPLVRERAACALAESGLFTPQQKMAAVPQLLSYTDDPSLDAQTHGWAFQALNDITHQHLPNDSAAWRSWYEASRN